MMRYPPDFPEKLTGVDFQTLEESHSTVFALSKKLKLSYLNPAWFSFAAANQGEPDISERFPVGTGIKDAMSEPFRGFYLDIYKRILERGTVWHHDYECSSPAAYRVFHEMAYPMHDLEGILVVSSLLIEKEHVLAERVPMPPIEQRYRLPNGLVTQCSYCRRFQRGEALEVWDWVPDWISNPPGRVSHSLCRICFDYYFKHHHSTPPTARSSLA